MVHYRRTRTPGACYFLTLALQDRTSDLLVRHHRELGQALRLACRQKPCRLPAIVLLPDHLHLLMTLPEGDAGFSSRIRLFKSTFVTALCAQPGTPVRLSAKGEANI